MTSESPGNVMSDFRKLVQQSSHYLSGNTLMMLSGFVSFPILTRIFSVSDYGTLNLMSSSLVIAIAICKMGLQNSVTRFYEEFKRDNRQADLYSTIFLSVLSVSLVFAFLSWMVTQWIKTDVVSGDTLALFSFIAVLIVIRSGYEILSTFLRAEQRTKLLNAIAVGVRYGSLSLSLIIVFWIMRNLYGFWFGVMLGEGVVAVALAFVYIRSRKLQCGEFSFPVLRKALQYGVPLFAWDIIGSIFIYADRYLVQYYLGSEALGIYSAGYNLSQYMYEFLAHPLNRAILPVAMAAWVQKGEEETKEFLSKTLRYYLLIAIPGTFGFIAVSENVVLLMASEKYREAAELIPYIVVGGMTFAGCLVFRTTLLIKQKTGLLACLMVFACILNIVMNVLLIPRCGLVGAALSTLLSYLSLVALIVFFSLRHLPIRIETVPILRYVLFGFIMFLVVGEIEFGSAAGSLGGKVVCGVVIYGALVSIFDREIREKARGLVNARLGK